MWLGNYDNALNYFETAANRNPRRPETWIQIGYCKVKQGRNDEAIRAYQRALQLLRRSRDIAPAIPTKSGLMVGLGEHPDEVVATLRDLRDAGCQIVTIGQYLRPSIANLPMVRYYTPAEFADLKTADVEAAHTSLRFMGRMISEKKRRFGGR